MPERWRYSDPRARIAQLVEHFHGKEGVAGSSPAPGLMGRAPRRAPVPRRLAPHPTEEGNLPALAAAFLGPLSIVLVIFSTGAAFFVSLPCAIAAIVLASVGRRKVDRGETDGFRGLATLGLLTGWIGVILSVLALVAYIVIAVLLDRATDGLDGSIVDRFRDELRDKGVDANNLIDSAPDGGATISP